MDVSTERRYCFGKGSRCPRGTMDIVAWRTELERKDLQALGRDVAHAAVSIALFALLMGFWVWLWVGPSL